MRLVAGTARGRRLVVPPGDAVRPTADRVREALFASLMPLLPAASVLDAFAGSGALGLEARSRGAARVTFIERERRAVDALRRNIATVGLDGTTVLPADAVRTLRDAARVGALAGSPYDLVLLDPPYALTEDVLAALLADVVPLLSADATVVVERSSDAPEPAWPLGLLPVTSRRYGSTTLHRARRGTVPADAVDVAPDQPPAGGGGSGRERP
jgi:16S rRNA (guanine966-N2)-methyltransferase